MFQPGRDRLQYNNLLSPPEGFRLDMAVGTTYSMDLETLLGIPLALALGGEAGEEDYHHGLVLLEAIRRIGDRVHIFCQAGQIALPEEQRPVLAFLEDSVTQVEPPEGYSFHPKLWVARYRHHKNKDRELFRVAVLSRNLTFDRSWDLAVAMDGEPASEELPANEPLGIFLEYLAGFSHGEKGKDVMRLARDVRRAKFQPQLKGKSYFWDYQFLPIGLAKIQGIDDLFNRKCHQFTIISPFLSAGTVNRLRNSLFPSGKMVLISRKDSLQKLGEKPLAEIDCWHLKNAVIDGEDMLEEEASIFRSRQDLHAKLYLKTRKGRTHLWIGSANCSHPAFSGNIEFLLRLDCYRYQFNSQELLSQLMGPEPESEQNPFERWVSVPEEKASQEDIWDKAVRDLVEKITRAGLHAQVTPQNTTPQMFQMLVTLDKDISMPPGMQTYITPLLQYRRWEPLQGQVIFSDISLIELSLFFGIQISWEDGKRFFVLKVPVDGIPRAERDGAIMKSIVRDRQGFLQYAALLLGDDPLLSLAELLKNQGFRRGRSQYHHQYRPVLFEKMLRAAARDPRRLEELQKVMEVLAAADEDLVPRDFHELFGLFFKAIEGQKQGGG